MQYTYQQIILGYAIAAKAFGVFSPDISFSLLSVCPHQSQPLMGTASIPTKGILFDLSEEMLDGKFIAQ